MEFPKTINPAYVKERKKRRKVERRGTKINVEIQCPEKLRRRTWKKDEKGFLLKNFWPHKWLLRENMVAAGLYVRDVSTFLNGT